MKESPMKTILILEAGRPCLHGGAPKQSQQPINKQQAETMKTHNTQPGRERPSPDTELKALTAIADGGHATEFPREECHSSQPSLRHKQPLTGLKLLWAAWVLCLLAAPCAFGTSYKYSAVKNTIYVYGGGSATLSQISTALPGAPLSLVDSTNKIWLLSAYLLVQDGCDLVLHGTNAPGGGDVNQLRLLSLNTGASNSVVNLIANYGTLDINSAKITSWNSTANVPNTNYLTFGRAYVQASSSLSTNGVTAWNSIMNITNSELCFLGDTNSGEQGVVWKVSGVDTNPTNNIHGVLVFGNVVNSQLHDNYIGAYTLGASGMQWVSNRIYNTASYGLELQNFSDNCVIQYNTFSNNLDDPFLLSDCYSNTLATNTFTAVAAGGNLRYEGGLSNWLSGNLIPATVNLSVASTTNGPGSAFVRNQTNLNVQLDTNSTTTFVDAGGRIYQPDQNNIQTVISPNGSSLLLTPAGIGKSTTVVAQDLYAGVNTGTAQLDQLIWNPPQGVQWTLTPGSVGQVLTFTVHDLSTNANYPISRGTNVFTNVVANVSGQLQFSDTTTSTSPIVYTVGTPNLNLNDFSYNATLNTIYLRNGVSGTLTEIATALPGVPLTLVDPINKIWLLSANLTVEDGSTLALHGSVVGGDVNQLRLLSLTTPSTNAVYLKADWGHLDINSTKITSWDTNANGPNSNSLASIRAYILARSSLSTNGVTAQNSRIDVTNSELCFLGSGTNSDDYGVAWKVSGVDPDPAADTNGVQVFGNVVNSQLHDNYIGAYTVGAYGMQWLNNGLYNNAKYGLDLQNFSDNALIQGNTFSNNLTDPFLLADSFNNVLATNTFSAGNGSIQLQGGQSNWLSGNSIPATLPVNTTSDTNGPGQTYVNNQTYLIVEIDNNSTTIYQDPSGRIYQPSQAGILTAISAGGSVMALTPAGIGGATSVAARDLFATATPGTAYLNQLVWNPPGSVQWTLMAGSVGQTLNFTLDDLTANTNYVVSRGNVVLTNVNAGASGQIQFSDTAVGTNAVVYSVASGAPPPSGLPISINFVGGGTPMGAAESAGVVAENNWNNAIGTNGTSQALYDFTGDNSGATLTWSASQIAADGTNNAPGNYRMIQGLINPATNTTTTVTVSGLLANTTYTVYVYGTENTTGAVRTAQYQISGPGITTVTNTATDPGSFNGTFTQANNSTGNYVVFTVTATNFTISATPVSANDGNLSAPINGLQIIPPPPAAPSAPANLSASAGNGQVSLAWTASLGTNGYNISYNLYRSTANGGPYAQVASGIISTNTTDTGLTNGTTYYYVVTAVNAGGESGFSSQASATPQALPPPPANLSASAGNGQVALAWTASSGAASYNLYRSTTNGGTYAKVASGIVSTNTTDTGLTNGTTYYYVVTAVNTNGESGYSSQASATPQAPPPPPANLSAGAGNGQVALAWTASSGAASYNLYRSTTNGGTYAKVASGIVSTNTTDTGLTNGTTYYYVVTAVNTNGESGYSSQASATPQAPPPPPANLSAGAGNGQVSLAWTASLGAASYNLYRSTTNGGPYVKIASGIVSTNTTDTGLTNGTTYYYVVTAVNAGGESGYSSQTSATPQAQLTQLSIRSGTNGLTVSWANGRLESTTNLFPASWQIVTTTNGQTSILLSPVLPGQFFRVIQP
jgi:fibronectin type 3 domain-containing protein